MQNIRGLIEMHQPDDFQGNIILKNNLKLNKYSTGKNCKQSVQQYFKALQWDGQHLLSSGKNLQLWVMRVAKEIALNHDLYILETDDQEVWTSVFHDLDISLQARGDGHCQLPGFFFKQGTFRHLQHILVQC